MTTLKMIIAVLGSLFFLGLFAVGFNTTHHQEMATKTCESSSEIQEVSFTCLASKNTQFIVKG